MRIGFVTIAAIGEGYLLFKIAIQVAGYAGNLHVFSDQGIFCFGMIEVEAGQKSFPTAGGVARLARLLEFTLVGIGVAGAAGIELHVLVARRTAGSLCLVALFTSDLYVQAGKGIFRFGVVEILGRFPAFDVMALGTFVSKLAFVRIGVTGNAIGGLAEERLAEVLHLDEFAIGGKHVRRGVAFFAHEAGVFAFELVAGLFVIKFLQGRFPADQVKGLAVVFQVAAHTIFAIGIAHLHFEVVTVLRGKILRDFFVTIDALEGGSAGPERVAGSALRGAAEGRVGFGERSGRDLRADHGGEEQSDAQEQERG